MSASREKQSRRDLTSGPAGKKDSRKNKVATIVISVVVIVAIVALAIWNSGIFQKSATAVTIGDQNYSTGAVEFYFKNAYNQFLNTYGDYASMLGLDSTKPLDQQSYGEDGQTWADYFKESALNNMQRAIILSEEARNAGISLSEVSQTYIQETKDSIKAYCVNNNISQSAYFASIDKTLTEKIYYEQLENALLADDYAAYLTDQMTYTDDEVAAYYAEHKADFDLVQYRYYFFSGTPEAKTDENGEAIEATEAETTAAMESASQQANAMADRLRAGEDFTALSQEYAPEDQKETYADAAASTAADVTGASISSTAYHDWMFDTARAAGDIHVSEESNGYYVLVFQSRSRNDYQSMNIRQILISPQVSEGAENATDEQKAAAKTKAEELLSQWESGAKTEDSFAALARENSDDTSTKDEGGLYAQVSKTALNASVSAWVFASDTAAGEATLIETDSGCYLVYIIGADAPYWTVEVRNAKKNADYDAWYTEQQEAYPMEQADGMKYVK